MLFCKLLTGAFVFVMAVSFLTYAKAQVVRPCSDTESDLITDQLTDKQIARWIAIERVALAEDPDHQPLHRTLHRLWKWAETSGHALYIELREGDRPSGSAAGTFRIMQVDPKGQRHMAVIQLYLKNIDNAYVGPNAIRSDGLIPMDGLSKYERYAEVLGHELAHAYHILTDLERTQKVYELVEQTNVLVLAHYAARRSSSEFEPELLRRVEQRDFLLAELEEFAQDAETFIWRELMASKKLRSAKRSLNDKANHQIRKCRQGVILARQ